MIKNLLTFFFVVSIITIVKSQNTVGVILNTPNVQNGYTLFTSFNKTYLINNCGEVINQWTSNYPPGNAVYLLENGNILRAGNTNTTDIVFGGQGGVIEIFDWEGNLLWQYFYDTPQYRQHHDIYPMPNGNILILAAKVMSNSEAIQAGRNPSLLPQSVLYSEQIVEVTPVGSDQGNIVWEWDIKNHLVQDFDSSKDNFGNVSENMHKLDINFTNGGNGNSNWLHINSIQYNEALDQIILSSRNLSEIWIIDHSTTTSQAASSSGGIYGKGGEILYRWGNPESYKLGTADDRTLFGQHYPHWIGENLIDEGKIILFNNGNGRNPQFSEVYIMTPPTSSPGFYTVLPNETFGPIEPDYIYADTVNVPSTFNSAILSSAQRLPNGNILICEGSSGTIFEIDDNNNMVWEYINPSNNITGIISSQGNSPSNNNQLFRASKYALDYPAFDGRDLTPGNPIELNFEINEPCSVLSIDDFVLNNLKLSPNPTSNIVNIETSSVITKIEIYNILGSKINTIENSNSFNLSNYESGMYLLKIFSNDATITKRVIRN